MRRIPLRVVCHAIFHSEIVPHGVRSLHRQVATTCIEQGAQLVAFYCDFGLNKEHPLDYPALLHLRGGSADALLVVRVPLLSESPAPDLLESLCLPPGQPMGWLPVPELRLLGLLPKAMRVHSFARLRACELASRGFPHHVIARWLDSEGFAPPRTRGLRWTTHDIAALLRRQPAYERQSVR
jgi:hypothetical protein